MKFYLIFATLLSASIAIINKKDYCWRNYDGEIPEDAVQAGLDASGKPIYIGQGFFLYKSLLPGTLHAGSTHLRVTAWKLVFTTDKYVKILCSRQPYNLQWVRVNYPEIALMTDVHLVEGGAETNSVVHIGRVRHEGSLEVGKVYNLAPYQGLTLPNRRGGETRFQIFDILVYKPSEIDVRSGLSYNESTSVILK